MPFWLPALVAGLALPAALPWLLPLPLVAALIFMLAGVRWWWQQALLSACLAFAVGLGWSAVRMATVEASLLPPALVGQTVELTGRVTGLVESGQRFGRPLQRFRLRAETCELAGQPCPDTALTTVQLNFYSAEPLHPDERWRLRVRLKRPHGFANPGGFDYESWLVAQGISATGSIASDGLLEPLSPPRSWHPTHWRAGARKWLDQRLAELPARPLLLALLVGDGSALSDAQWERLRLTGTVHLFVVSGLHISLSGGLILLLGRYWRRLPWNSGSQRSMLLTWLPALGVALLYALLAGFNLPIRRALVMFAVAGCALVGWRTRRPRDAWLLAAAIVLAADPLAVLQVGFWFSFVTVAVILAVLIGRSEAPAPDWQRWLRGWWRVQWACFVIGAPLVLVLAGGLPLNSLVANAVAIPLVSALALPAAMVALLAGALPLPLADSVSDVCWLLSDRLLQWLWRFLEWLPDAGIWLWQPAGAGVAALAFASVAALLLVLPRPFSGRWLAPVLLLPLLFPAYDRPATGEARVTVLDVGQGLSVLVRTRSYTLLYDTGPVFGSGLTAAQAAVLPALRRFGVMALDELMISHNDSDHAGGWQMLQQALPIATIRTGEPLPGAEPCRRGSEWVVDDVTFRLLHPDWRSSRSNDNSCVLWVATAGGSVLLPGDIGSAIEAELAWRAELPPSTVVVAPHHGSRSSSSDALVTATGAAHVVFSAGYANPFRHPAAEVVTRWQRS
ncbi:MAG: DNA internalization-related competence protein ComEC/Rec2, partial [Spongiibacteraceae bacterium]|nr:DNA internalization-related competence protein ComEC/Rec2 [Spongiibacteraceae bacterium]